MPELIDIRDEIISKLNRKLDEKNKQIESLSRELAEANMTIEKLTLNTKAGSWNLR